MTDRELLELAAKAAGIEGAFVERRPEDGYPAYTCGVGKGIQLWNPLTDDGDALRLAVKLKMDISIGQSVKVVSVAPDVFARHVEALDTGDDAEVVRLMIVSAAAEIGEAMP